MQANKPRNLCLQTLNLKGVLVARKNHIKHYKMLSAVDISSSQTSDKTNVEPVDQATIAVNWSAGSTPIGVITIEASNSSDIEFNQSAETWLELDFGVAINVSGNSGNHQIIFDSLPFRYIRIKYTRSSGSATMSATLQAKSVGA